MSSFYKIVYAVIILLFLYPPPAFSEKTKGFLSPDEAPNSLAILPPPPIENSAAFLNDKATYDMGRVLRDKERETLAINDAYSKNITQIFSSAYGHRISAEDTPVLYTLLKRVLHDSRDHSVASAKNHYMRVRPFVFFKEPSCTPDKDDKMRQTGSYPSGHASFGWAVALILSEINPTRQTEILKRGYDFGQSRVICGVHWQSDVDNGRLIGAAIVAILHSKPEFIRALEKAKYEFHHSPVS